ncbi:hypothetical protein HYC85_022501 [Camellia sinensis]|uniref:Trichome birefringence-like C-terminal domain-containing protein n=1 Tax=Camellia sinensis TaxID=4442 RepID=A0A7J7GPK3_CAMSI|nr:hypothetical protein HYC85_022501 [Camellia sinensis]
MKWRWKPDDCELPLFDAARFLEIVRGKSMAFVGDSLARNQMQSLGCMLSSVSTKINVLPIFMAKNFLLLNFFIPCSKTLITVRSLKNLLVASFVEQSNTTDIKFRRWFYPDYNFTLQLSRTPFLVKARGVSPYPAKPIDLYLDEVHEVWPTQVEAFDYVIISIGHWFAKPVMYHEKGKVVGCSSCKEKNIKTSPSEEMKGRGNCIRTRPFEKREMKYDWYISTFHMMQMDEFRVAKRKGRERGLKFRLLDVTEAMRPIDTWNELLLQQLKTEENEGKAINRLGRRARCSACSGLARKCTAMHRLPLFSFLHSSGGCQNLRAASLDIGEHHRLNGIDTGSGMWPPAIGEAIGRERIAGRHLTLPVGKVFLQNLQLTATEGKAKHGSSRHICTNHVLYHVCDSKGHVSRFSDHQSRISMHDGPKDQECNFHVK